jgi:hypothetical protein
MKQSTPRSDFRRGGRNRALPATAAALAGVAVLSVGIGAAAATPSHWEPYHFEYGPEATEDFCGVSGLTVAQQGVVDGRFRTTTHGPDGLSYDHDHGSFTDTWTNVETGEFVTVVGSYINDAHRVTDNGDGTLTILFQGPSRRERLNEDGERISLSAGLTAFELLIDHAGTPTDPSDDVFLEFLGFVKDVGLTSDFCTTVVQAIG